MNDKTSSYEKILTDSLDRAIDFVKFAEAKNGVLLTLSSAWFVAVSDILLSEKNIRPEILPGLIFSIPLIGTSAIISIFSFNPLTNLAKYLGEDRFGSHKQNLLYFDDISKMAIKAFEDGVKFRYGSGDFPTKDYISDLIIQIHINSKIASQKLRLFRWGLRIILLVPLEISLTFLIVFIAKHYF